MQHHQNKQSQLNPAYMRLVKKNGFNAAIFTTTKRQRGQKNGQNQKTSQQSANARSTSTSCSNTKTSNLLQTKRSPSCRKMSSSPPLRVLVSEPSIFHHFRHTFSVEFFRFFLQLKPSLGLAIGYLALEDVEKDCNLRFSGVREKLFLGASNTPLQGKLKTLDWTLLWEANIFLLPRHV